MGLGWLLSCLCKLTVRYFSEVVQSVSYPDTLLPLLRKLSPCSRVRPEKLTDPQLLTKFPAFYGVLRFITAFTKACYVSLSSRQCLGLPSCLFPSGFLTKTLYAPLLPPIRAICSAHLSLVNFITRMIFGEEYKAPGSLLCSLFHSLAALSLLGSNIFLSTLFSKTLSLHSSTDVSDQVSQPYKKLGRL